MARETRRTKEEEIIKGNMPPKGHILKMPLQHFHHDDPWRSLGFLFADIDVKVAHVKVSEGPSLTVFFCLEGISSEDALTALVKENSYNPNEWVQEKCIIVDGKPDVAGIGQNDYSRSLQRSRLE